MDSHRFILYIVLCELFWCNPLPSFRHSIVTFQAYFQEHASTTGKKLLFSTIPPFCENAGLSNSSSGMVNEAASDLTTCLFKSCKKTLCFQSCNFCKAYLFGNLLDLLN